MNWAGERLLVTGRLAEQVGESLRGHGLTVRVAPDPSSNDVAWATALCGFDVPPGSTAHIRWFHAMGAGVDQFVAPAREAAALLTRTVGGLPAEAAEFVAGVLLADSLRLHEYVDAQRGRKWQPIDRVQARPVTILGTGQLGIAIHAHLRALGYTVFGVNTRGGMVEGIGQTWSVAGAADLLSQSGALVIVLPLTRTSRGLVGEDLLSMLSDALLVNIGRGPVVDLQALRSALSHGNIRKAVLDVHDQEPLPDDSWCWAHPQIHVTPHVAARTSPEDVVAAVLECRAAMLSGGESPRPIDLSVEY